MKLTLLTLCDFAQDNNGKLTIVGTFNRLTAGSFPLVYQNPFFLVVRIMSKEPADVKLHVSLLGPDGTEMVAGNTDISFAATEVPSREQFANLIYGFQSITFVVPGTYRFRITLDTGESAETELYLDPAGGK